MAEIKQVVKAQFREYRTEISETLAHDNDLNWLRSRIIDEIVGEVYRDCDSIISDIENISVENARRKLRDEAAEGGSADVEAYAANELEEKLLEEIDEIL